MKKILIALAVFFAFVHTAEAQNIDIDLLRRINLHRPRALDNEFLAVTNTAEPLAAAVPVAMLVTGLIKKDGSLEWNAIQFAGALAVSAVVAEGLKYTVNRPRPYVTYPYLQPAVIEHDPSFPSGHSTAAFAIATSLSMNYPKWYVIAPSYFWASVVAYSRLDLGEHYPSDVLAGMLIGAGSAYLCYKGQQWLNNRHKRTLPEKL